MTENWYSEEQATLGDRLTAAREHAGLQSRELSARLGVRHKTLLAWENDEREPRANHLRMLAGVLGVSLMWLLTGEGPGLSGDAVPASARDEPLRSELRELHSLLEDAMRRVQRLEKALADG